MKALYRALLNSYAGFSYGLRTERAVRQEFAVLVLAVPAAFLLGETVWHRLMLILSVIAVLCIEFLNTCIEKLCDHVTPQRHEHIRAIKDMGSAACLCVQVSALVIWLAMLAVRLG